MEVLEKRHILSNLWELVRQTSCNTTCTSTLIQNDVLSLEDVAELDSIPNELKKTEKLFQLLLTRKGSYPHLIAALKEGCQTGALEILNKLGQVDTTSSGTSTKPSNPPTDFVRYNVLAPVLNFTGRKSQLSEIHQKLQENMEKRAVITQMASVVGLGGIGKTELARKYVAEYGTEFYNGNVIWINAQTEESLQDSFRSLPSDHLKISVRNVDNKELNICTLVDQIYGYFNDKKVLFVLDNAESTDYLQKFMPFRLSPSVSQPYILITSRDREWSFSAQVLELDEFTEEEAISFVKKGLQLEESNGDDDELLRLVNRLQRYPLALSQAVSFIKQRQFLGSFSISQYLEKFEENSKKLLNSKKPSAEFNTYRETTLTTWKLTTQQISSDEENGRCAMEILNSLAYFLPDKIPITLFSGDEYEEGLQLLVKYAMLNFQREEKTVSVHRLVQEVTRIQLKKENKEEPAFRIALQLAYEGISSLDNVSSSYHALSAFKYCSVSYPDLRAEFKHLPRNIVNILIEHMRYEEAQTVGKELEQLLINSFPKEDAELIRLQVLLAEAAYFLQENLEANLKRLEELHNYFVENKENAFSENELRTVERLEADYLRYLERYQEALQLSRKTFEQQKNLYGLNHWQTILTLVDITRSISLLEIGKSNPELERELSSGISLLKEAFQNNLELVGKDFDWTQTVLTVTDCFYDIREQDYATKIAMEVMKRTTNTRDKQFARILIQSMNFLALNYKTEGKYNEALAIYQNVRSKLVELKEDDLVTILQAEVNVLMMFLEMGELEAAVDTYTDHLKTLGKNGQLPPKNKCLGIQFMVVDSLVRMEKTEESLRQLGRMKAKMESQFGGSHSFLETVNKQIELLTLEKVEANA